MRHLAIVVLVAMLALVGCRRGDVSVQPNPQGGATVTVRLSEADLTAALAQATSNGRIVRIDNGSVDLQPGVIVINGTFRQPDGSRSAVGNVTLTPSIANGTLGLTIASVNLGGWTATDAALTQMNQRLAAALATLTAQRQNLASVTLQAVTTTDNELIVTLDVQRNP